MIALCLVFAGVFSMHTAAVAVPNHMEYDAAGATNFLVSPVIFLGTVTAGEPLLLGGYWTLTIDDTGWPDDSDPNARWDYIAATYYEPNYNPGTITWTGTFDEFTTASAPHWTSGKAGVGEMTGTAILQMSIWDFDVDQVIDADERAFIVFSGTLIVVKNGSGVFAGYCGLGSYSGSMSNPDPVNWADDSFNLSTILDVEDCSVPTKQVTWGNVKSLYSR
jgi:hypothetical protein